MGRCQKKFAYLSAPIGVLLLQACSGLGYQGGSIPTTFTGISSAQAISPQSIELDWTAYPGATKYNIYTPNVNNAIYTPGYNQFLFQPVPSDPTINYQYSVTAVDPTTGLEQGVRSAYTGVYLLPHFNFKNSGSVTAVSDTSIRVNWTSFPKVTYRVFYAERLPTGVVNYNGFVSSQNALGQSSLILNGLLEGHEYCAVVVAGYSDQTTDDPVGNLFTGDVGTKLNTPAYLVGPSGGFGDSVIAQSQQCIRTQSNFSVASLKIYTQKAQLSGQPVFYVSVPGEAAGAPNGTVSTSIYQVNSVTGLSTLIGTRIGTGSITAQTPLPSGRYKFFAIASDLTSPAQAQVEINVGTTGTTPTGPQNRPWVYVRAFNTSETAATTTGYYPEKQQGGYGSQGEGSSVAIGDFNCDGKKDIAIGIPNASVMASDNRPAQSGEVIIYYDTTSATPGTSSRSQAITFDITSFAGDAGRNLQLGTSLYAGNFNGDNQLTNQYGVTPQQSSFYQCDDLAIGSGYGPMFVLYGTRDLYTNGVISQYGGLNYASPTSYTLNPSTSCDPASNVCQVGVYTQANSYNAAVGVKMTSGDYNGDGYTDLAVTSKSAPAGTVSGSPRGIWVFRGSEYGLIAPSAYNSNSGVDDIATSSGPHLSFPYIPSTATTSSTFLPPTAGATLSNWQPLGEFGNSISTFHNAYYDMNGAGKGTGRIRDVLLIGNPNSFNGEMVHACVPKSDYTLSGWGTIGSSNDVNTAFQWDCSKAFAAPAGAYGFGAALADIKNPLRYRPDQFTDLNQLEGYGNNSASSTNLGYPGGFAVGAVSSNSYVYVYYGVNTPVAFTTSGNPTTDRNTLGADRNAYLTAMLSGLSVASGPLGGAALTVTTGSACTVSSNAEACNIQKIQHPTTAAGSFGLVISALPGNIISDSAGDSKDSILAVAAPYRNITLSNGTTYTSAGSVQLFLQNSQNNQIVVRPSALMSASNYPCGSDAVCRYADGFSNTLTTSIDYDGTLNNNTHFGLGGIAGGPLGPPDSGYNSNSDMVIGVPGHVAHPSVSSGTPPTVIDNGAGFAFFSHGGTYRNYEVANPDTNTTVSPWHVMDQSFSQESNMKFHDAISIGDINQDGIGDVAVRINEGSRNMIRIYNGSSTKVGFDNTAGDFTTFQIQGDTSAGIRFVPLGNITNSLSPAFLVSGASASYIMFGGIGGLVQGFPSVFGTGGTPRKLFAPSAAGNYDSIFTSGNSQGYAYLDFSDTSYYNSETANNLDSTLGEYMSFATGDFNGDGYQDFAIGFTANPGIADEFTNKGCTSGHAEDYCGSASALGGSVMVFYGGSDNGFQTQPDANGGYLLNSTYFTEYSADSSVSDSTPTAGYVQTPFSNFGSPCHADGTNCRIQMLHEGTTGAPTTTFGKSIASVPAGNCTSSTGVQYPVNALAVTAIKAGVPSIYTYRPKCLDTTYPNDYSGLISYADANPPAPASLTIPVSTYASASSTFGQSMISVSNAMGSAPPSPARSDLVSHLIVTDQANSWVVAYPVHTLDSNKASFIVPSANTTFSSDTNFTNNGGRLVDYSNSSMMSGTNGTATGFGNGLASIGDVNGDGYNDIGVGISALNRQDTSAQTVGQGTVLVLFGGPGGLQSHTSSTFTGAIQPSRTASCYISPGVGTTVSTCNPALLYVPEPTNSIRNGAYERSFLSPFSYVATSAASNESLGTFLFGVPGRDSLDTLPSQRILQGGAFYVLP